MKSIKKMLLYGFLIWLIPFVTAFSIYSIHESNRILFESIMPVVITICVVSFAYLYFKNVDKSFFKEGLLIGIIWFTICIAIDLPMFMQGPMKMTFSNYIMDIGLTYLIIPIIIFGFGYLLEKRTR